MPSLSTSAPAPRQVKRLKPRTWRSANPAEGVRAGGTPGVVSPALDAKPQPPSRASPIPLRDKGADRARLVPVLPRSSCCHSATVTHGLPPRCPRLHPSPAALLHHPTTHGWVPPAPPESPELFRAVLPGTGASLPRGISVASSWSLCCLWAGMWVPLCHLPGKRQAWNGIRKGKAPAVAELRWLNLVSNLPQ